MQKSAIHTKIEAQLQASIDLLKQAKRYVGQSNTIGGQDLSREISEFVATVDRNPVAGIPALDAHAPMIAALDVMACEKLAADFKATVDYMNEGCVCGRAPNPVHPGAPR